MNLELTTEFSLGNAQACAEACEYAYKLARPMGTPLVHGCVIEARVGNARGTVLAFRGTAEARDWVTDARFIRDRVGDGIEIHRGFNVAMTLAGPELMERAKFMQQPLWITGHSLGGALAVLAAARLAQAGVLVQGVYTFGQPRVFNRKGARWYDALQLGTSNIEHPTSNIQGETLGARTFRVVNEEDIVARVPGWLMGYGHVGQEVFLPSLGGRMRINPSVWFKLGSDLLGTYRDYKFGKLAQLADHPLDSYLDRLADERLAQIADKGIAST